MAGCIQYLTRLVGVEDFLRPYAALGPRQKLLHLAMSPVTFASSGIPHSINHIANALSSLAGDLAM